MHYALKYRAIELTLADGSFMPFQLQPVMDLGTKKVVAYEILYRGEHPTTLDGWTKIDQQIIHLLKTHRLPVPEILVNLSNHALLGIDQELLMAAAQQNNVCFELSEAHGGPCYEIIADRANGLLKRGLRIAIDDFGAGVDGLMRYGSLNRVAIVKLDRNFLKLALKTLRIRSTLNHLIDMWRRHQVHVIAEGVENQLEYHFAEDLGVDMVQGYYVDDLTSGGDDHHFLFPTPSARMAHVVMAHV